MPPPFGSIWQFWHLRFVDEENRGRANPVVAAKKQKRKRKIGREYFILIQPFRRVVVFVTHETHLMTLS
jgi:hypothetical protein